MPYPANVSERQRQLSTALSTNTPSQSKMMSSGLIIASFPDPTRAYTQEMGNNPPLTHQVRALHRLSRLAHHRPEGQRDRPTHTRVSRLQALIGPGPVVRRVVRAPSG